MKRTGVLTAMLVAALIVAASTLAEDKPWFDMENCSFCQHLLKDPHLLENMTWEHYDISNGLLSITTVKPEFRASYLQAMEAMEKLGKEMSEGKKDVKLCGHCESYGKLMELGAKIEHVATSTGDILLITSDKPEILELIQKHGQRTREELAKMEKEKEK